MSTSKIEDVIDQIEEYIDGCKNTAFSAKRYEADEPLAVPSFRQVRWLRSLALARQAPRAKA